MGRILGASQSRRRKVIVGVVVGIGIVGSLGATAYASPMGWNWFEQHHGRPPIFVPHRPGICVADHRDHRDGPDDGGDCETSTTHPAPTTVTTSSTPTVAPTTTTTATVTLPPPPPTDSTTSTTTTTLGTSTTTVPSCPGILVNGQCMPLP
jgi:hypothetical protein